MSASPGLAPRPAPDPAPPPHSVPVAAAAAAPTPAGIPAGPVGGGLAGTGSLLLPGEHFAAAICFLVVGTIGLIVVAPELAAGMYPSPRVGAVTHLFTLGWLTTTIFGALYQLLPVALGAPVRSTRVGHLAFAAWVPGVALFAAGIATGSIALHHAGIALVGAGILLVVGNVGASLRGARARDVTWAAVALALVALASTLVLGVALLHDVHAPFLAEARLRVLAAHVHVALVGWALVMIVGMSHRLLPMFLLAHRASTRWTRRALALLAAGVALFAVGAGRGIAPAAWLGAALIEGGVVCFLLQARAFFASRLRRRLDAGMRFAAVALVFLGLAALLGPVVLVAGTGEPRLATAYVIVGLLGGIVLYVVGFFYKIVPFLAWIARFRGRMGKEKVPTVAELYSARVATVQLVVMTAGVAVLGAGTIAGHAHCVRVGAMLFGAGVALFLTQIVRVAGGFRA
ncbi:MAG TPA: hypothetical protein VFZ11_11275 [Gemmatimonadaceae bacterium]